MVKKMLAWVLLAMLAVTSVGCTDGEEEENWWEVNREEIVVAVEFPGGNPERVEERLIKGPIAASTVVCPYQNGELIVPKYYLYCNGEQRGDVYVKQSEEKYLTDYEEWTRLAELRGKGDYKVYINFYAKEDMGTDSFIYQLLVYLTIQ